MSTNKKVKVSIQGYAGSFHDVVAATFFAERDVLTRGSFPEVFADVKEGRADYGIVAIENSIAGAILENFDRLRESGLQVVAEHYLPIKHNLIALPGQKISDITEVWSHPMALKQVQAFLTQYPHIKQVEADDTARVVQEIITQKLTGIAGVASALAAEIYGGEILAAGIETDPQNFTRFLIITQSENAINKLRPLEAEENGYKSSLYFETDHGSGALLRVLQVINVFKLNMTMLVSRPIVGQAWHYGFYVDFLHSSVGVDGLEAALEANTEKLIWLGTYPTKNS